MIFYKKFTSSTHTILYIEISPIYVFIHNHFWAHSLISYGNVFNGSLLYNWFIIKVYRAADLNIQSIMTVVSMVQSVVQPLIEQKKFLLNFRL